MSRDDELERLRESVVDERARRVYAEQELALERDRTAIWRQRAEERKEALRRRRQPFLRRRRRKNEATVPASAPAAPSPVQSSPSLAPYHPTLRVASWAAPGWLPLAADCTPLEDDPGVLAGADLVWVAGPGGRSPLEDWLTWPARQPLVLWEPEAAELGEWRPHLTGRDLVVGEESCPPAAHLTPLSVQDPRVIAIGSPRATSEEATGGRPTTDEVVAAALRAAPPTWEGPVPPHLEGLVLDAGRDAVRAGLRSRLVAARRHNPGLALEKIAEQVGLSLFPSQPLVSVLLVTRHPDRLGRALEQVARSRYPRYEVMLGLHGWSDEGPVEDRVGHLGLEGQVRVVGFPSDVPLGTCLNEVAQAGDGSVLAKFDDDDTYGPWYLDEAIDALTTGGADLVGKATQYVHLVHRDQLLLYQPGKEHSEVGYVNGPTFVMPRHTWERIRFPHRRSRVDSIFVRGLKAAGGTIASTSRYEFILGRHGGGHTWAASDERFLTSSQVAGTGADLRLAWLDET